MSQEKEPISNDSSKIATNRPNTDVSKDNIRKLTNISNFLLHLIFYMGFPGFCFQGKSWKNGGCEKCSVDLITWSAIISL